MTTQESDPLHPFSFCRHSSQMLTLTYSCLPHSWNKFTGVPWEGEHVAKTVSVFDLTLKFSLPFPAAFLKKIYTAVHNMGLPFLNHKFLSICVTVFVWSPILTYFTRTESWKEHRIQLCITALLFSWQSSLNIFRMVVTVLVPKSSRCYLRGNHRTDVASARIWTLYWTTPTEPLIYFPNFTCANEEQWREVVSKGFTSR